MFKYRVEFTNGNSKFIKTDYNLIDGLNQLKIGARLISDKNWMINLDNIVSIDLVEEVKNADV